MKRYSYRILFGVALVLLVALSVWWTVLIRQSIMAERDASMRELELRAALASEADGGAGLDEEQESRRIEERYRGRSFMVLGEGALLFLLVGVCFFMLARLVLQERRQVRAMRRFVSAVTHEMKTPLAGIKSLLQTAAAGNLPDGQHEELMGMGIGEAERLEHMIENVLIAGRLRTDRQPIRMDLARLDQVLDPFISHRRQILTRPDVLEVTYEDGVRDIELLFDQDGLRVVLENLVDNALKYGGDDPEVRIVARRDGGSVFIDVRDGGIGFTSSEAENLFRPFYRSASEGSSARHGTGLGLSIARALMRRMGGDATAASEGPGRGSCFSVRLPERPR